jgi:HEPN domain-containing protein
MSEQPEFVIEVRRWIEKAEHDLRNAEYVLNLKEDCPVDTVCFHCQQCAEKYLKALLISRAIDFPRTHDLVVLFNLSSRHFDLNLQLSKVQPLNRYSVEARYPGDWEPIDMREAVEAVNMARILREAVRSLLPTEILQK